MTTVLFLVPGPLLLSSGCDLGVCGGTVVPQFETVPRSDSTNFMKTVFLSRLKFVLSLHFGDTINVYSKPPELQTYL